jgi:hypothetical protein
MNTQNTLPDSISGALLVNPDRPSGIRLALARHRGDTPRTPGRAPEPRLPFDPPTSKPELHASQVAAVAADEIDWLYENTDDETDPVCVQARSTIEAWLRELSPEHQAAIALHHDPLPWPEELAGHEEDSFALVLHLLWPSTTRDMLCSTPHKLACRAHRRLELALEREGSRALHALIRCARWLFSDAVRAYAEVRGRVASVVPGTSSSCASSFDLDALN